MLKNASLWGGVRGKKQASNRVKNDFMPQNYKNMNKLKIKGWGKAKKWKNNFFYNLCGT